MRGLSYESCTPRLDHLHLSVRNITAAPDTKSTTSHDQATNIPDISYQIGYEMTRLFVCVQQ